MRVSPNLQWPTSMARRTSSPVSAQLNISVERCDDLSCLSYAITHISVHSTSSRSVFPGRCRTSLASTTLSDLKNLAALESSDPLTLFLPSSISFSSFPWVIHADDAARVLRLLVPFWNKNQIFKSKINRLQCKQNWGGHLGWWTFVRMKCVSFRLRKRTEDIEKHTLLPEARSSLQLWTFSYLVCYFSYIVKRKKIPYFLIQPIVPVY